METAMGWIRQRHLTIADDAKAALTDLVQDGYNALVGSRRLDLNDAASQESVSKAMGNLRLLVDKWIEAEVARGGSVLRIDTLTATQSENCPVFPFDD
jgi:hypothetical protein